ncbi:MAG: 6-bladed beta-propeller, partial [Candidatus Fermentibacteraceae bacterium]|nr:6-bladed beta-propeller [Candidatus Fermentibacteraceae bacterium]
MNSRDDVRKKPSYADCRRLRIVRDAVHASVILAALAVSCGSNGPDEAASEPWPDRIDLAVMDSIGSEFSDSSTAFGALGDVCFSENGDILVLDQARSRVAVFSGSGDPVAVIGGPGSGPGELNLPLAIARLGDGRIFVLDPMSNSYEIFDGSDYSYIEETALWENNPPMDPCGLDGAYYMGLKFEMDQSDGALTGISTLGRFMIGEADPGTVYWSSEFPVDLGDLGTFVKNMLRVLVFTGDPYGRVFYSEMSTEDYLVIACRSDGTELFRITADIRPVMKSQEEMAEEKAYMEHWISRMGGMGGMPVEWEPEPCRWMVAGLGVDGDHRLWVQRGTELMPVFDVFDMSGAHLFSARFPREGRSWRFHIESHGILAWEEDP